MKKKTKTISIRSKILWVLFFSILFLSIFSYFVSRQVFFKEYLKIEEDRMSDNIERVKDALNNEIFQLSSTLRDWAYWDDTYEFVEDQNQDFLDANLNINSIANIRLNGMVFLNSKGEIIFRKMIDVDTSQEISSKNIALYVLENSKITTFTNSEKIYSGIISIPEGPMLFSASQILSSEGEGPSHGTLVFVKFLAEPIFKNIESLTHLSADFYLYNSFGELPSDVLEAKNTLLKQGDFYVRTFSKNSISAYSLINDIYGKPVYLFKVNSDRPVYAQGLKSSNFFIFIMFLFSLLFGIIIVFFLEKFIISRILKLNLEVLKIKKIGDLSEKIKENKDDEIGELAVSINNMFSELFLSRKKEMEVFNMQKEVVQKEAKRIKEIEAVNIMLEKSKTAMLNVLEDQNELEENLKKEHIRVISLKEQYQDVVESSLVGIYVIQEGVIKFINPSFLKILGFDNANEVLGHEFGEFVVSEEKEGISKHYDDLMSKKIKSLHMHRMIRKNGEIFFTESNSNPSVYDGKPALVSSIQDITERKKLDDAKTSFISIASHQLRTPLTSIYWISEMFLNGDFGELSEKQKSFIEDIFNSNKKSLDFIKILLAMTRLEAGRVEVKPVPTDIKEVAESILSDLKELIENKKIKPRVNNQAFKIPKIDLPPEMFRQVVLNLISNAINYGKEGGKITIDFNLIDDENIVISVADDGIGIPKEEQKRIFEKFYRAENAQMIVPGGTGLGLNFAKNLVEAWNGKIWFESEEGKGTTFYFTVPLKGVKPKKGEIGLLE
ncbi:PAS domain S-box protein [Patescibacteria group bacterium]|nr:PAS domain S-box protein [Patescibacteria group bacterium]